MVKGKKMESSVVKKKKKKEEGEGGRDPAFSSSIHRI